MHTVIRRISGNGNYGLAKLWEKRDRLPVLSVWGKRAQLGLQALRGIRTSPFTSGLTIATIAAALVLLGLSILFLKNFSDLLGRSSEALKMSVYLKDDCTDAQRESILSLLDKEAGVRGVEHITKDAALKEFRASLGKNAGLLEGLGEENPLPASLEVRMSEDINDVDGFRKLAASLTAQPGVDEVRFNETTIVELAKLLRLFRTLAFVSVIALLLVTGFIISNTIKLGLYVYQDEIEIMRLVGASPQYIRAPFLIEGAIKGIAGSFVSIVLVFGIYFAIRRSMEGSSLFALLIPNFHFPGLAIFSIVTVVGILVGIGGSFLAVRSGLEEEVG